jgi:hypothetical protein
MVQLMLRPGVVGWRVLHSFVSSAGDLTRFFRDLQQASADNHAGSPFFCEVWRTVSVAGRLRATDRIHCDVINDDGDDIARFSRAAQKAVASNRSKTPLLCEVWVLEYSDIGSKFGQLINEEVGA